MMGGLWISSSAIDRRLRSPPDNLDDQVFPLSCSPSISNVSSTYTVRCAQ